MHIVLVAVHTGRNPEAIALGAACIAAALKADPDLNGHIQVSILESYLGDSADPGLELANRILTLQPDLVGLSVYLWNRLTLCRVAEILRASKPQLKIFAGGPDASADPDRIIVEFKLDFVVLGEGEGPTVAAIKCLSRQNDCSLDSLPGIHSAASQGRALHRAPLLPPASLISPWQDGSLSVNSGGGVLWELARGCPFQCTFCYESRGERGVRPFPLSRLQEEFSQFRAAGIRHVFVLDPTFNANRDRTRTLLDLFSRLGQSMHFTFELRAEFLDSEQAKAFAGLNCSVQIGLQSAHPAVLARVGRNLNRQLFENKIALLNRQGVIFGLDLIYGLPGDSLDGFKASLDWTLKLQPNHVDVFPLSVLPGTQLADDAPGFNLNWLADAPYTVLSQVGFPTNDMQTAAQLAAAVDWFYNRGRAVPWFAIILKALACKASTLLLSFAGSTDMPDQPDRPSHTEIEENQLRFLQQQFDYAGKSALWPAARDLIKLNGAYSRAIAEGSDSLLDLNYTPADLEDPSILNLAGFISRIGPQRGTWRIRSKDGRIKLEKIRH